MEKIDHIIRAFRENTCVGTGGFTNAADSTGPVAGFDPMVPGLRKRKDGDIDRRVKKLYKKWINGHKT